MECADLCGLIELLRDIRDSFNTQVMELEQKGVQAPPGGREVKRRSNIFTPLDI